MPPRKQPQCLRLAVRFRKWCYTVHPKWNLWRCYRSKWTITEVATMLYDRKCRTLKDAVAVFQAINMETMTRLAGPECRREPARSRAKAAA